MPRKLIRKLIGNYLPTSESMRSQRVFKLFGNTLLRPELWRLHRYSVASGVAIGMFCGLIPGPFQMLGAALGALWLRANLPIAVLTTLYTNPLTIVPLYLLAYKLGSLILHANHASAAPAPPDWVWAEPIHSAHLLLEWMVRLGPALALGIFVLACLLAMFGYVAVRVLWSLQVRMTYRRRRQKRKHSQNPSGN